ncbi:MAG: sigma-70 family RNA polymerase sigma factor, partial [Verrucomicrobia bacterium]|nr:sigma-70 family RNA polymerase sigma factor [Verrucomicrobiota bacterium]
MTDSQQLLAEYAKSGSESAFRELVTRYFGLVYSTALRLIGGDTHLAEDVAQTVFSDLARKAQALSSGVMLGGWLHQRTYNVAAPMMRAQRRRQSREREAAQMNALQDDPGADLAQVAPVLDEAIMSLGKEDRTAIMLCFFERRDFRSIGQALGSSEDAARMRVKRALDKLHTLLTHRGVTLSAAALGTALATEAVTAAPAGLAGSIAGAALARAAASGATITATKALVVTALRKALLGTTLVAVIGTGIYQTGKASSARAALQMAKQQQAPLVGQVEQLTRERDVFATSLASARQDNERLSRNSAELIKLRAEVARLRASAAPSVDAEALLARGKLPEWMEVSQRAAKNLLDAGRLLAIKQRLHLSPEQEAKVEENFNRRKEEQDTTNYPKYEKDLAALLTAEQLKQYQQVREERSHLNEEYATISSAAFQVVKLDKQLEHNFCDSCRRNVHLRIKEASVLALVVECWTRRRHCLIRPLFSAVDAAMRTR